MSAAVAPTEGRKASSVGERLWDALIDAARQSGLMRLGAGAFHEQTPTNRALYERAAVNFVASLTYAESEGVREALLSSMLLGALKDAATFIEEEAENRAAAGSVMSDYEREPRDLLERIQGTIAAAEAV